MADTTVSKYRNLNQLFKDMGFSVGGKPVHTEVVTAMTLAHDDTKVDQDAGTITTTTTTDTITPAVRGGAYAVTIPVSAVTGTSPTMDVVVQESDDGGTNWFDVYHFERITAVGCYRSPPMAYRGNRIRYVQTIGGTSPSFTRSIQRTTKPHSKLEYRQFYNRSINILTLNNSTAVFNVSGCDTFEAFVKLSAYVATGPALRIQFSDDGVTWYMPGVNLTPTDTSLTRFNVVAAASGYRPKLMRINVATAGAAGNVLDYIIIKAWKA